MIRLTAATALAASLAAGASAAELSHLPGADAAPPEQRQRLVAADAAEGRGDLTQAYDLLRTVRTDEHLDPSLVGAIDRERDALAQRLAEQLVGDARARAGEGHSALAEKQFMQALAYRSSAGDELRRFYGDPAVVTAVGGTEAVRARLRALDDDEVGAAGLRWHLAALAPDATLEQLDRQAQRLALLRTLAGDADAEVVAWAHRLAHTTAARVAQPQSLSAADVHAARGAWLVATAVVGTGDPDAEAVAAGLSAAQGRLDLLALGERESAWNARIGVWMPMLRAKFSASATPTVAGGGFAPASQSKSVSGTGVGWRLDAQWLREPGPAGAHSSYVWGAQLALASASVESDLVLADADTSASSVNGATFRSRIGIQTAGFDLLGGWRWALGSENRWSLQAHGALGAAAVHESYGTRRGVVEGQGADRTISKTGIAPRLGLEAELAWRPRPRWGATAALGVDALWLPSISSGDQGTLFSGSSSTSGSYHEDLSGMSVIAPYLVVGALYVF